MFLDVFGVLFGFAKQCFGCFKRPTVESLWRGLEDLGGTVKGQRSSWKPKICVLLWLVGCTILIFSKLFEGSPG